MTVEERYELSCYQELTRFDEHKNVWLVRNTENGMIYVKKTMQLYNREVYQRLMAADLPNIPKIYLCTCEDSTMTVIEEYIHGTSLMDMLQKDGIMDERQVAQIILPVCDIIEHLHSQVPSIVHRDIKPSNIMISNDGVIKLIDFNAAREYDLGATQDTYLMGTRHFAAPEQYGFGQSDPRTDIYAIGVTMYYMLTKNFPDSGLYLGSLYPVIQKCICMNKNDRYQTISELRKELSVYIPAAISQPRIHTASETSSSANPFLKPLYTYKEKLPVGFRSGVIWKMLTASFGYLDFFWLCSSVTVNNSNGKKLTGYPLTVNRVGLFIIILGYVFFLGNYCHVKDALPLMKKSKQTRLIMTFVYLFLYFVIIMFMILFLEGAG